MGGPGSGRWGNYTKKTAVERCLSLSILGLEREASLSAQIHTDGNIIWRVPATGERVAACGYRVDTREPTSSWIRLWYWPAGFREKISYGIALVTTEPYFSGFRWWFSCPVKKKGRPCGRRVGKLYLPPGEHYFGCRLCHNLTYLSCQWNHRSGPPYLSDRVLVCVVR